MFQFSHNRNVYTKSNREKDAKSADPALSSKFKVEMQTLQVSQESEQELYDSLNYIYGKVNTYVYL